MYLLGYIPRDNRIYLSDKDLNVYSYALPLSLIEYQTAVLRNDMETANKILPNIPSEQRTRIARFLEGQSMKFSTLFKKKKTRYGLNMIFISHFLLN